MRTGTVSYRLEDLKNGVIIPIGFVGENDFTRVIFDAEEIYKKYPSASVSMKVQPPKGVIYPATVTRDGNTVIWQVKEADVANRGGGELQLTFTDGETKIKTYIAKTDVKRSLAGNGPAPDPIQDFVDNANEKLEEVEQALDDLAAMDNIAKTAQASDIGKALSPKTVENGVVTEWEYITPGGGTEDYTDLDNKPSIAGVTLSGNKTLEDLGIAAADDLDNLADDVTDVKNDIQGLEDAISDFGFEKIDLVGRKYIDLSDNTVSVVGYPLYDGDSASYSCGIMPCAEGDQFIINGHGGGQTRLWGFINRDGNVLSRADADADGNGLKITAPANAAWIIIHTNNDQQSYKINNLNEEVNATAIKWNQGSVDGTTGLPIESTTRIYSDMIKCFDKPVAIKVGEGFKYSFRMYNISGQIVNRSSDWSSESRYVFFKSNEYTFRVLCAYTNDGTITPTDTINLSFTEETLSGIISVQEEIIKTNNKLLGETKITEWEQGSLTADNGTELSSTTRIRTGYITYEEPFVIHVDAESKVSYRAYRENGEFLGASDWINSDECLMMPNQTAKIRLVYAKKTDATITPAVETNVVIKSFVQENTSEGENQNETYTNSFLGNVSIRASKIINFDDGTAPVTDWYLIQSVTNSFYMSKDLKSKKFLFTFTPPSGYVSDWSAGITANNDVIFVKDASGLSTNINGRLNDANRKNPVYFLASENYTIMHELDFGSSKKPCGWLENVGFCLLPNGDIVMAEYTRGTVKTANVWHVSGDFTDPSNWDATWTENIIDVMDATTPGIKHCHEVQYDFFTGVLYFGTGDSETGSLNYYSTDNGDTWTLLYGEDKARCRRLNFIFTEEKVYWASDSYEADHHYFYIGERDENGLVDVENATAISLGNTNNQSCYGCVYLEELNIVVMMDRIDVIGSSKFEWYCYDIGTGQIVKIGDIYSVNNVTTAYLGFRCKYVDWYPVGNSILTGFNPRASYANPDTNMNALCGNQGGESENGSTRINNLMMHIYKKASGYGYRATTLWI